MAYQTRNGDDRKLYCRASNQAKLMCRRAVKYMEKNIASGVKENPKIFWSYVKSKSTLRESVASLHKHDGSTTTNDTEKAQVLQEFFVSVFTHEDLQTMPVPDFNLSICTNRSGDLIIWCFWLAEKSWSEQVPWTGWTTSTFTTKAFWCSRISAFACVSDELGERRTTTGLEVGKCIPNL